MKYISLQPSEYVDEITGKELQYIIKKSDYTYSGTNQLLKLVERMLDGDSKEIARKTTKYTYDNNENQLKQSMVKYRLTGEPLRDRKGKVTVGTGNGDLDIVLK